MTHSRDFGPLAGEMRGALERYSKEELIDLMTHIVRVYVLEENAPITPDVQHARAPETLERLSFPQLLTHLQMVLQLDELDRFRVSGHTVYVTIGEEEFQLDGPTPTLPPEALAAQAGQAPSLEEAEALQSGPPRPSVEAAARAAGTGDVAEPPKAPVTGDADFDIDDALDDHRAALRKAREEAGLPEKPRPQPVAPKSQRRRPGRMDSLFGGGGSSDGLASGLSMRPPPPPPPIADRAPGDPSPDEQRAARSEAGTAGDEAPPGDRRAGFDEPPPLAEGDREIKSSNRFADLELD